MLKYQPQFCWAEPLKYWPLSYKSSCRLCVPKFPALILSAECHRYNTTCYFPNRNESGMQPPAKREEVLTMWDCRMSRAPQEAKTLRSCTLWVSVIIVWTDYEQGMFLVLKGGKTTLFSLISVTVPYLKHDIKPDCQSKPKQILLEELQKGEAQHQAQQWAASDMADADWSVLTALLSGWAWSAFKCCNCATDTMSITIKFNR